MLFPDVFAVASCCTFRVDVSNACGVQFQSTALNGQEDGQPSLSVDAVAGPATMKAVEHPGDIVTIRTFQPMAGTFRQNQVKKRKAALSIAPLRRIFPCLSLPRLQDMHNCRFFRKGGDFEELRPGCYFSLSGMLAALE